MNRLILNQIGNRFRVHNGQWYRSLATNNESAARILNHREYTIKDGFVWNSPSEKIAMPEMTADQ